MKKLILPACALLIAFSSCNNQQSTTQSDVSVPVRVTEVVKKTIRNTLTVNGTVSPTGTSEVKTEAEGQYRLQRNPRTGAAYNIRSIPTLALFQAGREVARVSGAMGAADLQRWLQQHLA